MNKLQRQNNKVTPRPVTLTGSLSTVGVIIFALFAVALTVAPVIIVLHFVWKYW